MKIEVRGLRKAFGDKQVLSGFDAVFPEGKTTCLMGPSGCGKTTLLHILMGTLTPDAGEVTGVPERKAVVFQENRLFPDFTVEDNLRAVLPHRKTDFSEELAAFGLSGQEKTPVSQLSGGMKRRVALLRALCFGGDLFLFDEPFTGLDEETRRSVIGYVREKTAGKTVIAITHDAEDALLLGGDILSMP